jgi:hypothetical protein
MDISLGGIDCLVCKYQTKTSALEMIINHKRTCFALELKINSLRSTLLKGVSQLSFDVPGLVFVVPIKDHEVVQNRRQSLILDAAPSIFNLIFLIGEAAARFDHPSARHFRGPAALCTQGQTLDGTNMFQF